MQDVIQFDFSCSFQIFVIFCTIFVIFFTIFVIFCTKFVIFVGKYFNMFRGIEMFREIKEKKLLDIQNDLLQFSY